MKPLRRLPLILILIAFALIGVATAVFVRPPSDVAEAPQPSLVGGPFQLTDTNGHAFTEADVKGHPFLVFFGYTHCPDVCPTTLFQLSQVLKQMDPPEAVKLLFVTVDPARDTPKDLKDYLSNFDPHIVGLTGTQAQIDAMEHTYRVYATKVPGQGGDYSMDHTSIIYLMDKDGRFVSAFNLDRPAKVAAAELAKYL
ncbi:MAG TPA: SCO family protein [Methylovirgula sp.]